MFESNTAVWKYPISGLFRFVRAVIWEKSREFSLIGTSITTFSICWVVVANTYIRLYQIEGGIGIYWFLSKRSGFSGICSFYSIFVVCPLIDWFGNVSSILLFLLKLCHSICITSWSRCISRLRPWKVASLSTMQDHPDSSASYAGGSECAFFGRAI